MINKPTEEIEVKIQTAYGPLCSFYFSGPEAVENAQVLAVFAAKANDIEQVWVSQHGSIQWVKQ